MDIKKITDGLSVSGQIQVDDMAKLARRGFRAVVCNRPDGEAPDQPAHEEMQRAAEAAGLAFLYLPVTPGIVTEETAEAFRAALTELPGPVFGYCRTGTRTTTLWSLAMAKEKSVVDILAATKAAGYDMSGVARRIANGGVTPTDSVEDAKFDVVVVGGGAAGVALASSLKARKPDLEIAIIDPAGTHYYQPGWTMVGAGVFDAQTTAKTMGSLIPRGVHWLKSAVAAFEPKNNAVILDGCRVVKYDRLVVCPGLKLDWTRIEGLTETLGKNGVTSNYRYDLAPYTWKLVQELKGGKAIFTQPPMPIKCAGAPQKALYLSAHEWETRGVLPNIKIDFMNAGGVLFGVKDYVPALEGYIARYGANVNFFHNLVAIDGPGKTATFEIAKPDAAKEMITVDFDMIHVVPPQVAPDFIRVSPLADAVSFGECSRRAEGYRWEGRFTPPSLQGTIAYPPTTGGSQWGGGAVDPATGIYVVNSNSVVQIYTLIPRDEFEQKSQDGETSGYYAQGDVAYGFKLETFLNWAGMPCWNGPYGTIAAYDLKTGERLWNEPFGQVQKYGFYMPESWGSVTIGGPVITKSGLIFIGASMDSRVRALDLKTGKVLWKGLVDAPAVSLPAVYTYKGRQYVSFVVGGNTILLPKVSDQVVTFALPE